MKNIVLSQLLTVLGAVSIFATGPILSSILKLFGKSELSGIAFTAVPIGLAFFIWTRSHHATAPKVVEKISYIAIALVLTLAGFHLGILASSFF